MKSTLLEKLRQFKEGLKDLRRAVRETEGDRIHRQETRKLAESLATTWVEELRSPLEHKFRLPADVIKTMSESMKQLHVISRPHNRKTSYERVVSEALADFDDRLILPVQQYAAKVDSLLDLQKLIPGLADPAESDHLREAIECANAGYRRASVVLGWCAAVDRMQRKILEVGLATFSATSTKLKNQTSGKFKRWNKEFALTTLAELQTVFDNDLIVVLEGMGLLDGNQAERLDTCFQYRNHSAHPGRAPIEDAHLVAFFTDVNAIVLQNRAFAVKA